MTIPYSNNTQHGGSLNIDVDVGAGSVEGQTLYYNASNAHFTDTSVLHIDASNSRVGINTTAPDEALEVDGNLKLGTASGSKVVFHDIIELQAATDGTDGGSLEIKTKADGGALGAAVILNDSKDLIKVDGTTPTNNSVFSEGLQIRATSSSGAAMSLNCNDGSISNSTRLIMRKIPTGDVNDNTGTDTRDNEVLGYFTGQGVISGSDTVLNKITFRQDGTSGGEIILAVKETGGSLANALTINNAGEVGIKLAPETGSQLKLGNTSGAGKLTIESSDTHESYVNFSAQSNEFSTGYDKANSQFVIAQANNLASNQRMTISNSGDVAIPTGSLNVVGNTQCGPVGTGNATTKAEMISNAALTVKPHDSNSTNLTFAQINGGNGIGISTSNGSGTANWDTCIQPFGGRVGIGTQSPSDTLVVQNDSSNVTPILVIKNDNATDDNGVSIDFSGKDTSDNNIIFGRIAYKYTNHATEKSELQFFHRNDSGALDQQLTLDHDGNFGIGTAGPVRALHVNSGATNEVARFESSDTAVKIEFKDTSGTATLETRNDFRFSNSNGELVRFKDNGFVGIGTDNPIELLYLKSTSDDARLTIDAASGYDPEIKLYENGAVKQTIGYDSASSEFRIGTTNVDTGVALAVDSSSNVKILNALTLANIPTSASGLSSGAVWNDSGTLKIVS